MPHVGESVVEGTIGKWLKQPGDRVERFDPLVEVVTDKVTMEVPSPVAGQLLRIIATEGETVPMGAAIAEVETDERATPAPAVQAAAASPTAPPAPVPPPPPATPATSTTPMSYLITNAQPPAAGPATVPVPAPVSETIADEERLAITPVRRMIAEAMVRSASQIPHAWSMVEVDINELVALRNRERHAFRQREGINLTYLPFALKAVAGALKDNPTLNASWGDDHIVLKRRINLGIAVAAPTGLVVPVIHDADRLSIAGLAHAIDDLAGRARSGALRLEDVQGGTFTVNNTGALGSSISGPIINHPQAGILTTEAVQQRPVVINDAIAIRWMMNLCLSFDHRINDGEESGAFLQSVKRRLEAVDGDTPIY
ncbi:Lipoamide acyltransferase component of branched-chain alpha-keto acid dehydrogenase complex [Geodia barretti]|uniref:Dihydrolipoamide acetyltransferase component of pyruvate dehydrogenase complex n=2 Tax=Geodia barretti TaxID=519541 RepID=A0AA35TEX2_GEOBA|nr:Lipoamide acyltransferase component of branched-chain alpha-keto acid dehydrogenase complex [Geodia barretti]